MLDTIIKILPSKQIPLIDINANQQSGCAISTVEFTNDSEGVTTGTSACYWDFGNGKITTDCAPIVVFDSIGIYDVYFKLTDTLACEADTLLKQFIQIFPNPTIQLNDTAICFWDSIKIGIAQNFEHYQWSAEQVISLSQMDSVFIQQKGWYALEVTDSNGCMASDTMNLWVDSLPFIQLNDTAICFGDSVILSVADKYLVYEWNVDTQNTSTIVLAKQGEYVLRVQDGNLCWGGDTMFLTMDTIPDINLGGNQKICKGDSVELIVPNNYLMYTWTSNLSNTNRLSIQSEGWYKLQVMDGNFCVNSDSMFLQVDTLPVISLGVDTTICFGGSVSRGVSNQYIDYLWQPDDLSGFQNDFSFAGTYQLIVIDGNNCKDTSAFTLSINPIPILDLGKDTSICMQDSLVITVSDTFALYNWFPSDLQGNKVVLDKEGLYSLTVQNQFLCSVKDSILLTVNPLPIIDLGVDTAICLGDTLSLSLSDAFIDYQWNNTDLQGYSVNVYASGKYMVEVKDTNYCATKDSINLTINPLPQIDLGLDTLICWYDSLLLEVADTFNLYTWQGVESDIHKAWVDQDGKYTLEVTDNNLCKGMDNIEVQVETLVTELEKFHVLCEGELLTLSIESNEPVQTIIWNNSITQNTLSVTTSGNYVAQVISINQCVIKDSSEVVFIPYPSGSLVGENEACEGEEIVIMINTNADRVEWSTGHTAFDYTATLSGVYQVDLINEYNEVVCVTPLQKELVFHSYPQVNSLPTQYFCFEYGDKYQVELKTTANFYFFEDDRVSTQNILIVNEARSYFVESFFNQLCKVTEEVVVEELCPLRIIVPNAFTPNKDGLNDGFFPFVQNYSDFEMFIFNRWGELIYTAYSPDEPWDGTYKGNDVQQDVYVWYINVSGLDPEFNTIQKNLTGTVTLATRNGVPFKLSSDKSNPNSSIIFLKYPSIAVIFSSSVFLKASFFKGVSMDVI